MPPSLENAVTNHSNAVTESSDTLIKVTRHFHPSVWKGYDFNLASSVLIDKERHQELKKEVKSLLSLVDADSFQELDLVDKIQRLGVAYHFEDEIENILQQTYNEDYSKFFDDQNGRKNELSDLCYVSLRFRLLRQAGYYVSPVVFKKFKTEKGEFHANLVSDVRGMLSLFEASYLGFHGENIMDDAMAFTTKHLNSMVTCLSTPLRLQVQHSLTMPPQRSVERVVARNYISVYQQDMSRKELLFEFAKMDYNAVQMLHRKEISEVQSWWERMNVRSKLQYDVRDRVVEAYAITNNINFEPQFSQGRIHLGKLWSILTILDDSYDVFGNLDELGLLCDAFQRWDAKSTSKLSDPMKIVFLEVLNYFNEIETDMIKGGNSVGVSYFKKQVQDHNKNLLEEAKVIFSGDLPTLEKWLSLSVPSVSCSLFIIIATLNLGELATKEVFDWIASMPKIVNYTNLLVRLLGDIASLKVEQARGTNVSCVPCYMMDHGVSESEAIESLEKVITSLWKVMNQEGLRVHPVPMKVIKTLLNFNRTIALYYAGVGVDGHSISDGRTKEIITSIFIDPIPI
ncbi:hypothetical protein AQUCO_01200217v1 [Aquilegia coerulea]|uniref:Uncharacterized protein n=1 Tax=Aquilegia coerulea TaxID=218851 RepID=A0A2G5E504_AQUCA|nr:hypothetical protein AQUCO_01200217v1 [Aquilegia coerulea]